MLGPTPHYLFFRCDRGVVHWNSESNDPTGLNWGVSEKALNWNWSRTKLILSLRSEIIFILVFTFLHL